MTNNQERYYVVSEEELKRLAIDYSTWQKDWTNEKFKQWAMKAEAACRAREVEPTPPEPDCYLWKEMRK